MSVSYNIPQLTEADGVPKRAAVKINTAFSIIVSHSSTETAATSAMGNDWHKVQESVQKMVEEFGKIQSDINQSLTAMNRKIATLESSITTLSGKVSTMQSTIDALEKRVEELEKA